VHCASPLLRFTMLCMLPAARTIFVELQPVRIIVAVLLRRVVSLLTFTALQCNDRADIFLF